MGGNVFANGLEISGKAVQAQTIAAMPDVCFTPPENPATPPGVPIPYPSFGMASDTESGTATVLISGEIVNIKNKSDEKKTSGTEAGCAAKKGIITSKNTGKKYFNSWSTDVKFEGEPVIRFSDLATHNHASPIGNTGPWPEICKPGTDVFDCAALLEKIGMPVHTHAKSDCTTAEEKAAGKKPVKESEHFFENQMLQKARGGPNYKNFPKYDVDQAPCVCMTSRHKEADGFGKRGEGSKKNTPHYEKTADMREFLADNENPQPTVGKACEKTMEAVGEHHEALQGKDDKTKKDALDCLTLIILSYLAASAQPVKDAQTGKMRQPTVDEIKTVKIRT
ncbi:DUF4150 domain-containing protein [Tabrizicola piscis]|uniref:DUF4150 domain-containing protein n=1 Tax=Tabrizicola piscis TaxID=2494374 RepID=A0A3S8U7F2_9RHOB|nr:DUF4150 domain-containing protein [Tabrizicola piscis]AZL59586.1 DUF4150 domain-containing protein [Tabrizicola piscis]